MGRNIKLNRGGEWKTKTQRGPKDRENRVKDKRMWKET